MVVSLEYANSKLEKYFKTFVTCILDANKEEMDSIKIEVRAKMRKRSLSSLMNDIVIHNLRERLADYPKLNFRDTNGQLKVIFPEGFAMKSKQANSRQLVSMIDTQAALNFIFNNGQFALEGMPERLTNIILSYTWNKARTEIIQISLICPANKEHSYWQRIISLQTETTELLPQNNSPETTNQIEKKRVTPKRNNRVRKGTNSNDQSGEKNQ